MSAINNSKTFFIMPDHEVTITPSWIVQPSYIWVDEVGVVRPTDALLSSAVPVDIVIPPEIDGIKVTGIGDSFQSLSTIKSIAIPGGVTNIQERAFVDSNALESVVLSEGLISIGSSSFQGCTSLKSINIPSTVTSIGEATFANCFNIEYISVPKNVTSIGVDAFHSCLKLKSIIINKPSNSIDGMPWSAPGSTTINWDPDLFFAVEDGSVRQNDNLQSLLPSAALNLVIPSNINGTNITFIDNFGFQFCGAIKSIKIPDNITEIRPGAFYQCDSLTSVDISAGITYIDAYAFDNYCTALTTINIHKPQDSIAGAPWGAPNATVNWLG